jgi:hypothetical protein
MVFDGGGENKGDVEQLLVSYRIKRVSITAYHPQSNGLVEHGHDVVANSLSKYMQGKHAGWYKYFRLAIWANRISVRRPTGFSAFRLLYGCHCLLPIELESASCAAVDWEKVSTMEDHLTAQTQQLDQQTLDEAQGATNLRQSREGNGEHFNTHRRLQSTVLEIGDLVLLHNTAIEKSHNKKFDFYWSGPFGIREVFVNGSYQLTELDGTDVQDAVAGNRLKFFLRRQDDWPRMVRGINDQA